MYVVSKRELEQKIEKLRLKMYQAYNHGEDEQTLLSISKELDSMLNELEEIRGQYKQQ